MEKYLLLMGAVIMICILMSRLLEKLVVPSLLIFIALGMCFGENGLLKIPFNDYVSSNIICSVSLIFIMFYGGFGTSLKAARPVLGKALLMSTLGVVFTAGLVGLFAHLAFDLPFVESLLVGSVIASTDAASVFNILRSKKLSLKDNTDSLLEVESGSNDPISYMLTMTCVMVMSGQEVSVPMLLFQQIVFGILCGAIIGKGAVYLLGRFPFAGPGGRTIFVFSVVITAYAFPATIGGNGYLSVYLCGMIMGNSNLVQKRYLIHFFDVLTNVAQVSIFFLLGLLVTPVDLPSVFLPALGVMVFMTFIARPLVTAVLLLPFGSSIGQIGIVSWAGLRGVASIVFAILAVLYQVPMRYNLFNLVFCVVLLSISFQGTLLPWISKKWKMIDYASDVSKTFNDYQEESDVDFIKLHVEQGHPWLGKRLWEADIPKDLLMVMIGRDGQNLIPNGDTSIQEGDLLVMAARGFEDRENLELRELAIDKSHKWNGKTLKTISLPKHTLVIMIQRGSSTVIPSGETEIEAGDTLVIARPRSTLK